MRRLVNVLVFMAVVGLMISTASAAVIRVDGKLAGVRDFYMDETAVSRHIPDQYVTIQAGINASAWGDTIIVADGTYAGTGNKNLSFFGKLLVLISENGSADCVIDCEGTGRGINLVSWEPVDSTIQGFTIRNGGPEGLMGASIRLNNSSATVVDCILEQSNGYRGGAIDCENATLNLRNSTLANNSSTWRGGALASSYSSVLVDSCTFIGNSSIDNGGAIYSDGSTVTIVNSDIQFNSSGDGGGGIYFRASTGHVNYCLVSDNIAERDGGGIFTADTLAEITNSMISGNISYSAGGGIYMRSGSISNCLITENTAFQTGGGLVLQEPCNLLNSTIAWNTAFVGCGGLANSSASLVTNCIFWGDSPNEICDGGAAQIHYCTVLHGWSGEGNISEDPLFVQGPSGDYYLSHTSTGHSETSPCHDAGSNEASNICFNTSSGFVCMDDFTTRTDHELDSGIVDMGFHYGNPTPAATPPPTSTPVSDCEVTGVELWMPAHAFYPGDPCSCSVTVCNNTGSLLSDHPLFVILDIHGLLLFGPDFLETPGNYGESYPDFAVGETVVSVLGEFSWPANVGSQSGIIWYAAMTNPEMTNLFGEWDLFVFGWDN